LALSFLPTHGCIHFGPGTFKLNSQVTYSFPSCPASIKFRGEGIDVTELTWPTTNGIQVNYDGLGCVTHWEDMTVSTGAAGGGVGIFLNQLASSIPTPYTPQSTFVRVFLRGTDGDYAGEAGTNYWATAIKTFGVSWVSFDTVHVNGPLSGSFSNVGTGLDLEGTSVLPSVVYNITNSTFNLLNKGINYGNWVQGVTINHTNCNGDTYCVYLGTGLTGTNQLSYTDGLQCNVAASCVFVGSATPGVTIAGNFLIIPSTSTSYAADLEVTDFDTIYGNTVIAQTGNLGNGFKLGGTVTNTISTVHDNILESLTTANLLTSTSVNAILSNNAYDNNTTNVSDLGTGDVIDVERSCSSGISLQFGGTSTGITYGTKTCNYFDDNRSVRLQINLTLTAVGSASGNATIAGLPIAANGSFGAGCTMGNYANMAAATPTPAPYIAAGTSSITLGDIGSTGNGNLANTNFTNTSVFNLSCVYPK
jgi:hypothetical protein